MNVSEVARIWQAAGVSIIPIMANQTKRPAIRWSPYQATIPTLGEVDQWWGNGKPYGLALICGAVSGNLEMVEVEGRAMGSDSMGEVINRMDELGAGHVWDRLNGPDGYSEMSPSGGLHLLYRIVDHEVPGNEKIAQDEDQLCLAETRGRGGYCIVAPTPGICHPSGESWDLLKGNYGTLPLITWAERNLLHEALRLALDNPTRLSPPPLTPTGRPSPDYPKIPAALPVLQSGSSAAGLSPGDDFEQSVDWSDDLLLGGHGWTLESRHGSTRHWTRPGKSPRDGASATTGHAGDRDRLYVFSTSTIFKAETSYTKLGAYAVLSHNGDHHAAAGALAKLGFGKRQELAVLDPMNPNPLPEVETFYRNNDEGNSLYLHDRVAGNYHWLKDEKTYYGWSGKLWQDGCDLPLEHEFRTLAREHADKAERDGNEAALKRWIQAGNVGKVDSALKSMRSIPGVSLRTTDMNPDRHLVNVRNGILNLNTQELLPHDPSYLMTRMLGASYDPTATCPQFEAFLVRALPDEGMRSYIQRALGYSLLGDVDQRSIFWIFGPPGTGKSTLMDTIRCVFGDYGLTAAAGAFRAKGKDHGPSNDLHSLRGKRFVTTSETAESTSFDEDLLKRLSGRDQVTSRALYQEFQEWTPECALWMATNNAPRFNSDDDAIWRRTKLIPFSTVFTGEGEVKDLARSVLALEADGILNWLLAGLADYQANGLGEPGEVKQMADEQRVQSDSVARFLDDKITDGILVQESGREIRTSELFAMYMEWARQMGERALGSRRFNNRVLTSLPELDTVRSKGYPHWSGLGRQHGVGMLGMLPSWESASS